MRFLTIVLCSCTFKLQGQTLNAYGCCTRHLAASSNVAFKSSFDCQCWPAQLGCFKRRKGNGTSSGQCLAPERSVEGPLRMFQSCSFGCCFLATSLSSLEQTANLHVESRISLLLPDVYRRIRRIVYILTSVGSKAASPSCTQAPPTTANTLTLIRMHAHFLRHVACLKTW